MSERQVPQGSVTFDRAVEYYDQTRALDPVLMDQIVRAHAVELVEHAPTLEIGVGTGRYALPLHEAGVQMVGIDISRPMMEKLVEKAGGSPPFPLLEGDATKLPFADGVFGSALVVHVFHLVPNWQDAASELLRGVRPGGRLVTDFGHDEEGEWDRIWEVFRVAAELPGSRAGADEPDEVHEFFVSRGAVERPTEGLLQDESFSYGEVIDQLQQGIYSATWSTDDRGRRRGAEAAREWVVREGHDLSDSFVVTRELSWHSYDLP